MEKSFDCELSYKPNVILGNILIGYSLGWSAPVARKLQDLKLTPLPYVLTEGEVSWVTSILTLGVIIGANGCGYLSNVVGRKPCLMLGGLLVFLGFIFVTAAVNLGTMHVGRFLAGLGVGSMIVTNLVYIGEIGSKNIRGLLLASTGVMHTVGCLVVYSVGPFVSYYAVGGIILTLSAVYVAGCRTLPESPMYYIIKGKENEAKAVLRRLGRSNEFEDFIATKEILLSPAAYEAQEITTEINDNKDAKCSNNNKKCAWKWLQLFTVKSNRKAFIITVILFIIQQTGGSVVIIFYATTIFHNAGSSVEPNIATIILGSTEVFGTLFTPILIEKMGRKVLILVSTSGCSVCLGFMGIYFYLDSVNHPCIPSIGWLPLMLLILNVLFYNIGLNVIPSTLIGEMFSPEIRSTGSCLSMTTGLVFSFISGVSFGYLKGLFGSHIMFWNFAIVNAVGFLFCLLFVPETKGKSLVEIEALLAK